MPELIDVAPGSPEWQAPRRLGITATDIVTITGDAAQAESDEAACLAAWSSYYRRTKEIPAPKEVFSWGFIAALEYLRGEHVEG